MPHDLENAPPSFNNDIGDRIVFVDVIEADYQLTYHAADRVAQAQSTLRFISVEEGYPVFCLRQRITSSTLNGEAVVCQDQSAPDGASMFKIAKKKIAPGEHTLVINSVLEQVHEQMGPPVRWQSAPNRLHSVFNMSDLRADGGFLEAYLPSNFEYDQFKKTLSVSILASDHDHRVFSNGRVTQEQKNQWTIEFPEFFTTSCPWFHVGPTDEYETKDSAYQSVDGRSIPVQVYATKFSIDRGFVNLNNYSNTTHQALEDLESDFGFFPHDSLLVFATGSGGGMEYAGATATNFHAIRHELDHSYFARCIIPANGDAGWIDEAIAKWADKGYPQTPNQPIETENMGNRSLYIRTTHRNAYTQGSEFLAHLNYLLHDQGGLKKMLRAYLFEKRYSPVQARTFQQILETFHGASLADLFNTYVYGGGVLHRLELDGIDSKEEKEPNNPYHSSPVELMKNVFPNAD